MMEPRPITQEVLDEFFVWTRTAVMFKSSPEGRIFGEELRSVFMLASKALLDGATEARTHL